MKRKRYTEEQIISILKEHEAGASVPDIARRHGVAENTVYKNGDTHEFPENQDAHDLSSRDGDCYSQGRWFEFDPRGQ